MLDGNIIYNIYMTIICIMFGYLLILAEYQIFVIHDNKIL